jgi:hypothetical protein
MSENNKGLFACCKYTNLLLKEVFGNFKAFLNKKAIYFLATKADQSEIGLAPRQSSSRRRLIVNDMTLSSVSMLALSLSSRHKSI